MAHIQCPKCKIDLLRIPAVIDGVRKDIWSHPDNPLIKCDYAQDGIKMTTEVIDIFLMTKFQELVEQDGVVVEPSELVMNVPESKGLEHSDKQCILQQRLLHGDISIREYDEIIKRTKCR